jgi:5'-nucleotidase
MPVILFDLDDTLFDHQYCSRVALATVQEKHPEQLKGSLESLDQNYQELLEHWHRKVIEGMVTLDQSRLERFRILLSVDGTFPTDSEAWAAAQLFREAYDAAYRAVPGAIELLKQVREEFQIGIVTNHVMVEQVKKIELIGVEPYIDELIVSNEVGVAKPEPGIFEIALARLGGTAGQTVMIGDSWRSDIVGATSLGMRAIWLNRYGQSCPDPKLAKEIRELEPVEQVLTAIRQT